MISLSAMSSSELRRLRDGIENETALAEFVSAATRFLLSHPLDGGANEDLVYMVGRKLTNAGVWEILRPSVFYAVWMTVGTPTINVFLQSAPEYLLSVKQHVATPRDKNGGLKGSSKRHHLSGDFIKLGRAEGLAGPHFGTISSTYRELTGPFLLHHVSAYDNSVILGDTESAAYVLVDGPHLLPEIRKGYLGEAAKLPTTSKPYKKRKPVHTGKFK